MCTYRFTFDDKLMDSIRPSFKSEEAMNEWMQKSMTLLLMEYIAKQKATRGKCRYSDEELEILLADRPSLKENNIPEVSNEDYKAIVATMPHKPFKQVERWL